MREEFDFVGTAIRFSFRDEKQIKANREKAEADAKAAAKALANPEVVAEGEGAVAAKAEVKTRATPKVEAEVKTAGKAKAYNKPEVKPNYKAKAVTKAAKATKKPFKYGK